MTTQHGHITLVPYGGLGNRMKVIAAGIKLAQACGSTIDILWFKDKGLACRYDQLFQPLHIDGVRLIEASRSDFFHRDRPRLKNLYLPLFWIKRHTNRQPLGLVPLHRQGLNLLRRCVGLKPQPTPHDVHGITADIVVRARGAHIWITSCVYFMGNDIPMDAFDIFHPQPDIQSEIDTMAQQMPPHTVGLHIRRTDNAGSMRNSRTEDFIEVMELQPTTTHFYLATDEAALKQMLKARFEGRIISLDHDVRRDTVEGMRDAVIEMYLLARTSHIYGSHSSTFSETPAAIGRVPYNATDSHTADTIEPPTEGAKKILTIIVSYNFMPWIDHCLGSLRQSETTTDVMVIDNHSTDATVATIKARYPEVMLIQNQENLGFGRANNIGMLYAIEHGYDSVLLLNQDAWIDANCLGRLVEASRQHPRYGILSPIHLTGDRRHVEHGFGVYSGVKDKDHQPTSPLVPIDFIDAAIWYMPMAALKEVGLFDPIWKHYGEDKDLANRMHIHFYRVGFMPHVYGCHDREFRVVDDERRIYSERVYHLSVCTDARRKAGSAMLWNLAALTKKAALSIGHGKWKNASRYMGIALDLMAMRKSISEARQRATHVNLNNYKQ